MNKPIGAYVTYIDVFNDNEVVTNYFSFGEYREDTETDTYGVSDPHLIYFYTTYDDLLAEVLDPASGAMGADNGEILKYELMFHVEHTKHV